MVKTKKVFVKRIKRRGNGTSNTHFCWDNLSHAHPTKDWKIWKPTDNWKYCYAEKYFKFDQKVYKETEILRD